jgi:serine protease Do
MRRFSFADRRAALAGAALSLVMTVVVPAAAHGQDKSLIAEQPKADGGEAAPPSAGFRQAAVKVRPAVVGLRVTGITGRPFGAFPNAAPFANGPFARPGLAPNRAAAGGSGVVVDAEKGFVLTSDSLISGALHVDVILADGRERPVGQVRRDPRSDLALLVIDPGGLTRAEWGNSDTLEPGDWVLAVGRPDGQTETVSAGVVSARSRVASATPRDDLMLTDALTTPGGPLVNRDGQVVGIATAPPGPPVVGRDFGSVVPASVAKRVAADLAREGAVRRAYLGVWIGPVDPSAADRLGQPGAVAVNEVSPDSPAAKAGLRRGDVILRFQGKPVEGQLGFQSAVEFAPIGEPVTLTIDRNGERLDLEVRASARPESPGQPGDIPDRDRDRGREPAGRGAAATEAFPDLGLRLNEPDQLVTRRFRLRDAPGGPVIVRVVPGSPADRGGLEPGMVITAAGGRPVASLDDFRKALADPNRGRDLIIRVRRGAKDEVRVIPGPAQDEGTPQEKDKGNGPEKDKDRDARPDGGR